MSGEAWIWAGWFAIGVAIDVVTVAYMRREVRSGDDPFAPREEDEELGAFLLAMLLLWPVVLVLAVGWLVCVGLGVAVKRVIR